MFTQPTSQLQLSLFNTALIPRKYKIDDHGRLRMFEHRTDESARRDSSAQKNSDNETRVPEITFPSFMYMASTDTPLSSPQSSLYREDILRASSMSQMTPKVGLTIKSEKSYLCYPKNDNDDSALASSESDCLSADRDEFSFSECMSSYNEGTISDINELFDKSKNDEIDDRTSNEDIDDFADEEVRTITNFDLGDDSPNDRDSDIETSDIRNVDKRTNGFDEDNLADRNCINRSGTTRSCLIDYRSYKRTPLNRVTFADARGYELEKIRYLTPPNDYLSPMMVMDSLNSKFELLFRQTKPRRILIPLFEQPNSLPSFLDNVLKSTVMLEYAFSNCLSLYGSVRIKNVEFEKNIYIRYTIDDWKTVRELKATYSHHHDESDTDSFSFYYNFSIWASNLHRIEFAVQYKSTKGEEIWDNNNGNNYALLCKCS